MGGNQINKNQDSRIKVHDPNLCAFGSWVLDLSFLVPRLGLGTPVPEAPPRGIGVRQSLQDRCVPGRAWDADNIRFLVLGSWILDLGSWVLGLGSWLFMLLLLAYVQQGAIHILDGGFQGRSPRRQAHGV